jgi:HprK-related kinase A
MLISLDLSPFRFLINTNNAALFQNLQTIYPAARLSTGSDQQFYDFVLSYRRTSWLPGSPYNFRCGKHHFRQSDADHLVSTFEWGLNWTLSSFQNYYLCIHAAVLEKNNQAVILPAPPGSGKSTLCALLMLNGWRLLSDEHCLVDLSTGMLVPAVRPIAIKNRSFAVIKQWAHSKKLQCVQDNTLKGSVGYLPASELSWQLYKTHATPAFIIMPSYSSDPIPTALTPIRRCDMVIELVKNSFNYQALAQQGFDALTRLVADTQSYALTYHNTAEALSLFEGLANA